MKNYCSNCVDELELGESKLIKENNWNCCERCGKLSTLHGVPFLYDKQEAIQYLLDAELSHRNEWVEAAMYQNIEFVNRQLDDGGTISKNELNELIGSAEDN